MNRVHYQQFSDIPSDQLYSILKLRQDVFIIEQNCIYSDIDNYDQKAEHLLYFEGDTLIGYSRLLPPGIKYPEASIGRIISNPDFRRKGIGRTVVSDSIQILQDASCKAIRIEAQAHLQKFYSEFGFKPDGSVYDLDGIPHLEMVLSK